MKEIWKEIEISGYFISNLGRLKGRSGKILNTQINHNGYKIINLHPNGKSDKSKCVRIHRLVAQAFISNPENKPFVNHIDGNKQNNVVTNLEWCTAKENTIHAFKNHLCKAKRGEENIHAKLTNEQAEWIRQNYIPRDRNFSCRALGKKFGIAHTSISKIIRNKLYLKSDCSSKVE